MLSTSEIRDRFLKFFEAEGHRIVPSSSLVPGNDKTLLFTNAGMVQFKDVFTGQDVRDYKRAVTSQRCVRAGGKHNDLDNVGYTARHHTFFEMLGNFSFGDYFKAEAIRLAWQFLTEELALPREKLWVTVFREDDEAAAIWHEQIGVPADRIIRKDEKDNFWMMGDTGPCGPCSEIFYDHGPEVEGGPPGSADEDGDRYIEVWNLVFMQFERAADGTMSDLPKPSVDTGMGLERIAAVLQHVHSNYDIDLFRKLISKAAELTATDELDNPSLRVLADHIRAAAFLIVDGVLPGNDGRGYVLRRIIRRALRHGHKLGVQDAFFYRLVPTLVAEMGEAFPELQANEQRVSEQLKLEEERFAETLSSGMKILEGAIAELSGKVIPGATVFKLYDTYGFPVDLTADIARERGLEVDEAGFAKEMTAQRERARAASGFAGEANALPDSEAECRFTGYTQLQDEATVLELWLDGRSVDVLDEGESGWVVLDTTPFYAESGGQVGDSGELVANAVLFAVEDTQKRKQAWLHRGTVQRGRLERGARIDARVNAERRRGIRVHHSATHLLHGALRDTLGTHVEQRGSFLNDQHLRFDFSHDGPLDAEERTRIERWIDQQVRANHTAEIREMSMQEALDAGAMALFGEKYGSVVRVVKLGDESIELCGGTHVDATGEIGAVRLVAESGVAAGIRRIEARAGAAALAHDQAAGARMQALADSMKTSPDQLLERIEQLNERNRELNRELDKLKARQSAEAGAALVDRAETLAGDVKFLATVLEKRDARGLREVLDSLRPALDRHVIVLASEHEGKAVLVAAVHPALHAQLGAGDVVRTVSAALGGRGGGKADLAQGGAASLQAIDQAFADARELTVTKCGAS